MAKQSGIHQIRGKVGEHSYYRQTGIESGLVRSINQALSGRVKTGEEYANTRLNNAEFGQAGRIAAVLGQFVTPKYRPMILPFSQSKMLKVIIEALKSKTGTWGQRNLGASDVDVVTQALNSTHKNNPDEWGLSYGIDSDDAFVIQSDTTIFPSKLSGIGADGVDIVLLACRPWIGTFVSSTGKYAASYARANIYGDNSIAAGASIAIDYEFRPAPTQDWPATYVDFFVVVILPYRTINTTKYTLQEHCTFVAMDTPERV